MRSLNKVALMGYLATDPEVKPTVTGKNMAKFSIATNRDWRAADGEQHQVTDFHKVVAWSNLADICSQYLKKGAGVYLEGRISNRHFKDREGNDRRVTEIVADLINFITLKKNKDVDEVNLVEVPV